MREKYKRPFIVIITIYAMAYLVAFVLGADELVILLKPGATLLAWLSMRFYTPMLDVNRAVKKLVSIAFISWFIADVIAMVGELIILTGGHDPQYFYQLEIVLYAVSRVFILLTIAGLYRYVTKKTSKFQVMADLITLGTCIVITIWLVFFKESMGETIPLLIQGNALTVFSLIYICISLVVQGLLLMNWLYFKERSITIGHKAGLTGLAIITFTDLMCAFYPGLLFQGDSIDLAFKAGILLVAIGGVYFDQQSATQLVIENGNQKTDTWKNGFYFLAYPLFTIYIVGWDMDMLIFPVVIGFYMVCCLYTRQIEGANAFLDKEKAYNEKLTLYSEVLHQAALSVVITDVKGSIEYVNPYFTKVTGYSEREALGQNPRILKSGMTSPEEYASLWKKLLRGNEWRGEFKNIDKEGRSFYEKATIVPIKNEKSITTHYVAIKENITEAKRLENNLKNQHYFTMQLLDAVPSGIFYVSKDDVLLGMNTRLKHHYGFSDESYVNEHLSTFPGMSSDEYRGFCMMKEKIMATHHPSVQQVSYVDANGKKGVALYSLSVYYLANGSIGGYLGLFTDITELKEKESALEVALKKANAATEAKSQFLANMSHEIRTPMNAVIGMSHLALQTRLNDQQKDYVLKIHGAATTLLGIINDILDFSKIESGRFELETIDFNLEKLANDTMMLFVDKTFEKELAFRVHLPLNLPRWYQGDPLRLGQILTNLVGNAIKFTKAGEVALDVRQINSQESRIQLQFLVQDTGIGINPKNLERLFEPFIQSDSSTTRHYGGTGLGLAISKNLVEMMGGRLWAKSIMGVGSTFGFTVWLEKSRYQDAVLPALSQSEEKHQAHLAGLKILLAEDNPVNRQIAEEFLKLEGALVDSVENGEEALNRIIELEDGGEYDLILMDIQMPVMDGFEATRKIRIINRSIPILAMTARTMVNEREECIKNGMNDHIAKPIEPQLLYRTILKYIDPKDRKHEKNMLIVRKERQAITIDAESIKFLKEIDGIDQKQLVMRMGNNPKLIKTLLLVFAETHAQMAEDIQKAMVAGDEETLKKKLHTAKGVLGNIDATRLYEQVCLMEGNLQKDGLDAVLTERVAAFASDFDCFYQAIMAVLSVENQEKNAIDKLSDKPVDLKNIESIIKQLLSLLEEGDSEAPDCFDKNREALAGILNLEESKRLAGQIHSYTFDEAADALRQLLKKMYEEDEGRP